MLCEKHSLHVAGTESEAQIMQCINCGYVSSTKFIGKKEDNKEYKNLSEDMKKWAVEKNDRIWIPTVLTLPIGMLYPIDIKVDGEEEVMKWAFAEMVDILEDEKENYPDGNGGFYKRRFNTDTPKIYDEFIDGMYLVNQKMKNRRIKIFYKNYKLQTNQKFQNNF